MKTKLKPSLVKKLHASKKINKSLDELDAAVARAEFRAVRKYGKDTVDQAYEWALRQPPGLDRLIDITKFHDDLVRVYQYAKAPDVNPRRDPDGWRIQQALRSLQAP